MYVEIPIKNKILFIILIITSIRASKNTNFSIVVYDSHQELNFSEIALNDDLKKIYYSKYITPQSNNC